MDGFAVQKWERTKELAIECGVKWQLSDRIQLFDHKGMGLGHFNTVAEAYAFLCGYEHSIKH